MKWWTFVTLVLVGVGVALVVLAACLQTRGVDLDREVNSRVRYPNEEAIATKACGNHRLMAWWIENPRKDMATMHVRCAGVVTAEVEVRF